MSRLTSTNQEFAHNIQKWVMFCFNYPHTSELDFMNAWKGSMKEHLGKKFSNYYETNGATGVMNNFYVNLDGGNQMLLSEWVLKNYSVMKLEKGGSTYEGGGEIEQNYEVGDIVELSESGWDNESYHDFFNDKDNVLLLITDVYKSTSEHQGYDEFIGQALYSTKRVDDNEEVPFDLYDWELESDSTYSKGGSTYELGGSADSIGSSVEIQVVDMLLENTGQHFMDSGGDKGRQWQRNQDKIFQDEPRVDYEVWNGDISDTVSAYHYLTEILDTDEYSYEVNQYLRSDKDEEGDACHWIDDCKERLENSEEFSEIEWIGKTENSYNYENNLSQVFLNHTFKNPYTEEVYCLFQLHGGADVRGGYTNTRCFKLLGYLTGQVDVYGSVDGVDVTNTYNGYSLTNDEGEDIKATNHSDINLDFQIYDDLPYEDGGKVNYAGGGKTKTTESFVEDLMNFSPYGAMSQMFIIDGIGK